MTDEEVLHRFRVAPVKDCPACQGTGMAVAEDIVSDEPCPCTEPGPLDCYRAGLLAAARMASARAGVYGHSIGCGGRPSPSEKLQSIHERCSRCQFKKLASDLRKKAGKA